VGSRKWLPVASAVARPPPAPPPALDLGDPTGPIYMVTYATTHLQHEHLTSDTASAHGHAHTHAQRQRQRQPLALSLNLSPQPGCVWTRSPTLSFLPVSQRCKRLADVWTRIRSLHNRYSKVLLLLLLLLLFFTNDRTAIAVVLWLIRRRWTRCPNLWAAG